YRGEFAFFELDEIVYDVDALDRNPAAPKLPAVVHNFIQFKKGELATVQRILDEIELISLKRTSEGLNETNFTVGVLNCFFLIYLFGAHPEHLWLAYLVEGTYMIPKRFRIMWNARPLNQALYYLDFCWMMNFVGSIVILALMFAGWTDGPHEGEGRRHGGSVSVAAREALFNALLGVSTGPLMGANIALPFVACLFHDVSTMTGLFIHVMPPMVMYTFMWKGDLIREAWPRIFSLSYAEKVRYFPEEGVFFVPGSGLGSVAGNAIALYLLWWIPYVCFMLLVGIDLPRKYNTDGNPANPKYDTVFHSTMRQGACVAIGHVFRGRSKSDSLQQCEDNCFDLVDFFIYMAFHLFAALSAIYVIGYPCFVWRNFHLGMICAVVALAVMRGSRRYTYYATKMYSRTIRKSFKLEETKHQ
ncbi:hypothetical protein ACHAW6_003777, partial [Cyclotella cf. meneghiniana]